MDYDLEQDIKIKDNKGKENKGDKLSQSKQVTDIIMKTKGPKENEEKKEDNDSEKEKIKNKISDKDKIIEGNVKGKNQSNLKEPKIQKSNDNLNNDEIEMINKARKSRK